jgi:hypothetical protein
MRSRRASTKYQYISAKNRRSLFHFIAPFFSSIIMNQFLHFGTALKSVVLLAVVVFVSSCRTTTEPPKDELEEILPNIVTLTLSSPQGNSTVIWRSTSTSAGVGTATVRIDTLVLATGRTYTGAIAAVNDTKTPVVDLTEDYRSLANEHQFFYAVSGDAQSRVTITITDKDGNNLPLGLQYTVAVSSGEGTRGTLNVVLGHYDDVKKDGKTRSPESDIDITFPIVIR